jgi:hypothetical protein
MLLLASLMMLVAVDNSYGQDDWPICADCPDVDWTTKSDTIIVDDCVTLVYYKVRNDTCQGSRLFDISIYQVFMDTTTCSDCIYTEVLKSIKKDLLTRAFTGNIFTIRPSIGGNDYVRFINPACWKDTLNASNIRLIPCSEEECCIDEYSCDSKKDHHSFPGYTHVIVINRKYTYNDPHDCPPHLPVECSNKCDSLRLFQYETIGPHYIIEPTSANNQQINNDIQINPNPSSGIFKVNINDNIQDNISVKVLSIEGVTVISNEFTNSSFQIDLSNIEKGYYIIMIYYNNHIYTEKVIVMP